MSYKAAIFDLDGTLVDSLADLADAINYALKQLGQPVRSAEFIQKVIGDGIRTTISRTLEPASQALADSAVDIMRQRYAQICFDNTMPYEGIAEVVTELYEKGIKLAILTNKQEQLGRNIVNHFFGDYFTVVAGTTSSGPAKPNPQNTLKVLNELKVMPEQTVFIGDCNVDIKAAKACNIFAVGVGWGWKSSQELTEAGADDIVDKPSQLLDFFKD
ncbi:MAG: HAD family hydrolase [Sedimentisphaerales bacterium]|nr:HAD family hydrolase [Sedimentisphaerales bacterium]